MPLFKAKGFLVEEREVNGRHLIERTRDGKEQRALVSSNRPDRRNTTAL